MVLILPNFLNFDRLGKNQNLRNFPFRVYLRNLISAKKFSLIHLRNLIIDQSFKFIFTGIYHWVFSNNIFAEIICFLFSKYLLKDDLNGSNIYIQHFLSCWMELDGMLVENFNRLKRPSNIHIQHFFSLSSIHS